MRAVKGVTGDLTQREHSSQVPKHNDGHWTGKGSREGCSRQKEAYMQRLMRMEGIWTVGGTTECPVWPKPSEQEERVVPWEAGKRDRGS